VRSIVLDRAKALNIDIEPHIQAGRVRAQQFDPAELSPGEFAVRIVNAVEDGCKLVVIDSLNGYLNAMPGEKFLSNQLHELCSHLNQQRVLTILVLAQHGMVRAQDAPVDISYLADSVVTLRYFETEGEVKQAVAMIKKRSGPHEKTIREFRLETGKGICVGAPLKNFRGILAGTPMAT
jgi:circadian clock protein KaiC